MALKLSEGITNVREKTRHDVDTRVSDEFITKALNRAAVKVRQWLASDVPTLYLKVTDGIDVDGSAPEISLVSTEFNYDNLYVVERFWESPDPGEWVALQRADDLTPNRSVHGLISFHLEHLCLIIGPAYRTDLGGTYRVKFHPRPVDLSDINAYFQVPASMEEALEYLAIEKVAERDGDSDSDKWHKRAKASYDEALPALQIRYGAHQNTSGLRRIVGY